MNYDYSKERKDLIAMVAMYVGMKWMAGTENGIDFKKDLDSIDVLAKCVSFAESFDFPLESDDYTIDTGATRDLVSKFADELCDEYAL